MEIKQTSTTAEGTLAESQNPEIPSFEVLNNYHWDFASLLPHDVQELLNSNSLRNRFNACAGDFFSKIFPKYFSEGSLRLGLDDGLKKPAFDLLQNFFTRGFNEISVIFTDEKSIIENLNKALISLLENNVRRNRSIPDLELVRLGQQEFINLLNSIPGIEQSGKGYRQHIVSKVDSDYITPITFENNSLSQAVLDFCRKAGYLYFDEKSVRYLARTDLVSWLNEKINPKNSTGSNVEISVSEKQLAALFSDAGIWVEFLQKFYLTLQHCHSLLRIKH